MNNKLENLKELLATTKLNELLHKKEDPVEKTKHTALIVLAVIGAIAAVAGIAYAVYKLVTPNYLEDFDDDFDDEFDDDFEEESSAAEPDTME